MIVSPLMKILGQIGRASNEIDAILHDPPNEEIAELADMVRDALDNLEAKVMSTPWDSDGPTTNP